MNILILIFILGCAKKTYFIPTFTNYSESHIREAILKNTWLSRFEGSVHFSNLFTNHSTENIEFLKENYSSTLFQVLIDERHANPQESFTDLENTAIVYQSYPVIDVYNAKYCLLVSISTFYQKNWKSYNEYFFVFDISGHTRSELTYDFHLVNSPQQINTGHPQFLPDINNIDTSTINKKMRNLSKVIKSYRMLGDSSEFKDKD
jgi:hypothetical protein